MLDHGCFFGVWNKPSLMFLESLSAFQKWSWFINHYFKYSRFKNSAIWWPRIAPNILMFLESFTECQKSNRFINFFLRYCWFENPAIWLAERIYNCAQIKILNHILRLLNLYLYTKNQVDSSFFSWDTADLRSLESHNSRTRISPDMPFVQAQNISFELSFNTKSRKN